MAYEDSKPTEGYNIWIKPGLIKCAWSGCQPHPKAEPSIGTHGSEKVKSDEAGGSFMPFEFPLNVHWDWEVRGEEEMRL